MTEHRRLFQLIDLDRTLFDTSRYVKELTDEMDVLEPGYGKKLDERFELDYKREKTFFLLRVLREHKGDDWFESTAERVIRRIGGSSLLLSGAQERVAQAASLADGQPSWGILTYGDDVDQRMKVKFIGLEGAPFLLTDSPSKGELIASWVQPDGTFLLPEEFGGGTVDTVTLEDDKLRAFRGLPEGAYGFWLTNKPDAEALLEEAQRLGEVGDVTIVRDLAEVANYTTKITTVSKV